MKISPGTVDLTVADILFVGGTVMVILVPTLWELGATALVMGLIIFVVAVLKGI